MKENLPTMKAWIRSQIASFGHAFSGIGTLVATQPHARFHGLATLLVVGLGLFFRLSTLEWAGILGAVAMVWVAEALNTAVEFLADEVTLERKPLIKKAKDTAAGAVLIAACCAAFIGALIFIPHVSSFLSSPKDQKSLTTVKYCYEPFRTFEIVGTDTTGVSQEELPGVLRQHKINHPRAEYELLAEVKCVPEQTQAIIHAFTQAGIRLRHYWAPVSSFSFDMMEPGPYGLGHVDIVEFNR